MNVNTAGNTTFNQANGSLSGGGTLNIESGTFDYSGGDTASRERELKKVPISKLLDMAERKRR